MRVAYVCVFALLAALVGGGLWLNRDPGADLVIPEGVRHIEADPAVLAAHTVEVPAAGGCPAASFRSPRQPDVPGSPEDGSLGIDLGGGAFLLTACIGPLEDGQTLEELVTAEIPGGFAEGFEDVGLRAPAQAVERVTSAHGTGYALTSTVGRSLLTDHYVLVDGVVHAVGHLRPIDDPTAGWPVVATALASWEWHR